MSNASASIDKRIQDLVKTFESDLEDLVNDAFEEGEQSKQEEWDDESRNE